MEPDPAVDDVDVVSLGRATERGSWVTRTLAGAVALVGLAMAGWLVLTGPEAEPDGVPLEPVPTTPDSAPTPDRTSGTLSPDGDRFAFADVRGIHVTDRDGSRGRLVWARTAKVQAVPFTPPRWSPDGTRIAFLTGVPVRGSEPLPGAANLALTLTLLDLGSGRASDLHDLGACFCVGIPYPRIEWREDGDWIEVGTVDGRRPGSARTGLDHAIRADGSGWQLLSDLDAQ